MNMFDKGIVHISHNIEEKINRKKLILSLIREWFTYYKII